MMHPDPGILAAIEKMRREEIRVEFARHRLVRQARRATKAQTGPVETPWRRALAWWAALRGTPLPASPRAGVPAAPTDNRPAMWNSQDNQARLAAVSCAARPPCQDRVPR